MPKKAKTVKVLDDIESVKIDAKITKFSKVNEIETGRVDYHHDDSNPGSVNVSSSQQEFFYGRDSAAKPFKD